MLRPFFTSQVSHPFMKTHIDAPSLLKPDKRSLYVEVAQHFRGETWLFNYNQLQYLCQVS